MIFLTINEEELRKALADIGRAKERGFTHTEALMHLSQVGQTIEDDRLTYANRVILKAGPTPNLDFGNTNSEWIDWYRFENGQVIDT
jgi:hypothetical protein